MQTKRIKEKDELVFLGRKFGAHPLSLSTLLPPSLSILSFPPNVAPCASPWRVNIYHVGNSLQGWHLQPPRFASFPLSTRHTKSGRLRRIPRRSNNSIFRRALLFDHVMGSRVHGIACQVWRLKYQLPPPSLPNPVSCGWWPRHAWPPVLTTHTLRESQEMLMCNDPDDWEQLEVICDDSVSHCRVSVLWAHWLL